MQREAQERQKEYLRKAIERFEKTSETKAQDPQSYFDALVDLALGYRGAKENSKGDKVFEQAVSYYKEFPGKLAHADRNRAFWQMLANQSQSDELDARFFDVLKIAELNTDETRDLDRMIIETLGYRQHGRSAAQGERDMCAKILSIRESVRGKDDPSLIPLVDRYASACEAAHEIDKAEAAYLRADSLGKNDDPGVKAGRQVDLAQFYLRHGMFDKADAAWRTGEKLLDGTVNQWTARGFLNLADQYNKAGHQGEMDAIISTLLADGGDDVVSAFDPKLSELVNGYFASFSFVRAEDLIQKRIKASAKCTSDTAASDWRLKLSDLYLATGRLDESNKLFDQVMASVALQGRSTDYLKEKRAQLLLNLGRADASAALRKTIPPPVAGPIVIQYLLLATQEVRLGHNTTIDSYDSSDANNLAFAPINLQATDVSICSLGTIRKDGNCLFFGKTYCGTGSPGAGLRMMPSAHQGQLAAPRLSIPAALKPPPTCMANALSGASGGMHQLAPGDFLFAAGPDRYSLTNDPGRRRLFLEDGGSGTYVYDLGCFPGQRNRPIDLQVWYSGTHTIKVAGLKAVVYAPNATVEIPFNGTFAGAIVADRIVLLGNNHVSFDKTLLGAELK